LIGDCAALPPCAPAVGSAAAVGAAAVVGLFGGGRIHPTLGYDMDVKPE